ncbi:MAG TPA: hypothetical protein VF665_17760 [Longimicrobium sp.]|uniref:hypothetical protein n=1 Tax=Longimicrobium sp. TaxID=2029185 RepID=UPI002ED78758
MHVSSHALAAALARRINAVLPAPLLLRAEGNRLDLYADGSLVDLCAGSTVISLIVTRPLPERYTHEQRTC